jgi:putative ABC transport system permease protein
VSADGGRLRLNDGLRVASVGLRARPLRAALSALGIAIGTAAIVGILGLSSSSQAGLLAEIDRLGTNMLTVEAGQSLTGQDAQLPEPAALLETGIARGNWLNEGTACEPVAAP